MPQPFEFSPIGQLLQALGKAEQARDAAGQLLPMLRDPHTKRIIEIARGVGDAAHKFPLLQPITAVVDVARTGIQTVQIHRGFQKTYRMIEALEQNLGVLQTTTAVIGVGVAITGVLSAVNLYQTMKLRGEVQQLRREMTNGFLDLRDFLKGEFTDRVSQKIIDEIYSQERRRELERAYAKFVGAKRGVSQAIAGDNPDIRSLHLANAIQTMQESLAIYSDPYLLPDLNAPGQLRRMECSWTIEQAIALTYQLQGEAGCASQCLEDLQKKIRRDALMVISACKTEAELDFVFPELTRIHYHDLPVLETWQTRIDVMRSLPPRQQKQLAAKADEAEASGMLIINAPKEDELYQTLKAKSHFQSLLDLLKFIVYPELRQKYEVQLCEQASTLGYEKMVPDNWQKVSDLTVANLYWYLQTKAASSV